MRAARIHDWQQAPRLDEVPEPEVGDGDALLEVEVAGVGHLDLTISSGQFARAPELPYIGGVEGVGRIVRSVRFPEGTRVLSRGGGPGMFRDGLWAPRAAVPERGLVAVPAELDPGVAAVFATPATTAEVAVRDVGQVGSDDRVVVTGAAGAVGSLAVQVALSAGAEVIAVVGRAEHADRVPGDVPVIVGRGPDAAGQLEPAPTVLVDTVGGAGLAALIAAVTPGGRAVLVGYTAGTDVTLDLPNYLLHDVAILPVNMMRRGGRARDLVPDLADRFVAGELALAVETVPLDELPSAIERLRSGAVAGRLAVRP